VSVFTNRRDPARAEAMYRLKGTYFVQTFYASGYSPAALSALNSERPTRPDVYLRLKVQGPEPGYVATPVYFVQCAQAVLQNRKVIPNGVLTPAIAFAKCDVPEKMALDNRFAHTVSDV
jgi:hypothetical protein